MSTENLTAVDQLSKWVLAGLHKRANDTTHPVENADDGTTPATTGAPAAEAKRDAEAQTPGQSAAAAAPASDNPTVGGTSGTPANQGTGAAMAGELKVETPKSTADDPGTSHEAKVSELRTVKEIKAAGLAILSSLATAKSASAEPSAVAANKDAGTAKEEFATAKEAQEAGARAADAVIEALGLDAESKQASLAVVDGVLKSAAFDAQNVVDFLTGFVKSASGEIPPELLEAQGLPPEALGAQGMVPPEAMGAPEPEISPEELLAVLEEAGVTPVELLEELVESGEIPPEVAQNIVEEAVATAEAIGAEQPQEPAVEPPPAADAATDAQTKGAAAEPQPLDKKAVLHGLAQLLAAHGAKKE